MTLLCAAAAADKGDKVSSHCCACDMRITQRIVCQKRRSHMWLQHCLVTLASLCGTHRLR